MNGRFLGIIVLMGVIGARGFGQQRIDWSPVRESVPLSWDFLAAELDLQAAEHSYRLLRQERMAFPEFQTILVRSPDWSRIEAPEVNVSVSLAQMLPYSGRITGTTTITSTFREIDEGEILHRVLDISVGWTQPIPARGDAPFPEMSFAALDIERAALTREQERRAVIIRWAEYYASLCRAHAQLTMLRNHDAILAEALAYAQEEYRRGSGTLADIRVVEDERATIAIEEIRTRNTIRSLLIRFSSEIRGNESFTGTDFAFPVPSVTRSRLERAKRCADSSYPIESWTRWLGESHRELERQQQRAGFRPEIAVRASVVSSDGTTAHWGRNWAEVLGNRQNRTVSIELSVRVPGALRTAESSRRALAAGHRKSVFDEQKMYAETVSRAAQRRVTIEAVETELRMIESIVRNDGIRVEQTRELLAEGRVRFSELTDAKRSLVTRNNEMAAARIDLWEAVILAEVYCDGISDRY